MKKPTHLLSKCCHAPLEIVTADEGTSYWKCSKCQEASDPVAQADRQGWEPNDLDGSNGIKKQFIAKCHVEAGAGGFLRFPLPGDKKGKSWLDERLMAEFVEQVESQSRTAGREEGEAFKGKLKREWLMRGKEEGRREERKEIVERINSSDITGWEDEDIWYILEVINNKYEQV